MSSQTRSPNGATIDATKGTYNFINADNIKVYDLVYSTAQLAGTKAVGNLVAYGTGMLYAGTYYAYPTGAIPLSDIAEVIGYASDAATFGSPPLTVANLSSSSFGIFAQYDLQKTDLSYATSGYIIANDFRFDLPPAAVINYIGVTIIHKYSLISAGVYANAVDLIECYVDYDYTPYMTGVSSITGLSSITF